MSTLPSLSTSILWTIRLSWALVIWRTSVMFSISLKVCWRRFSS